MRLLPPRPLGAMDPAACTLPHPPCPLAPTNCRRHVLGEAAQAPGIMLHWWLQQHPFQHSLFLSAAEAAPRAQEAFQRHLDAQGYADIQARALSVDNATFKLKRAVVDARPAHAPAAGKPQPLRRLEVAVKGGGPAAIINDQFIYCSWDTPEQECRCGGVNPKVQASSPTSLPPVCAALRCAAMCCAALRCSRRSPACCAVPRCVAAAPASTNRQPPSLCCAALLCSCRSPASCASASQPFSHPSPVPLPRRPPARSRVLLERGLVGSPQLIMERFLASNPLGADQVLSVEGLSRAAINFGNAELAALGSTVRLGAEALPYPPAWQVQSGFICWFSEPHWASFEGCSCCSAAFP